MGGYAMYVWPSFAIAFVVITVLLLASLRSLRQANQALARVRASDET